MTLKERYRRFKTWQQQPFEVAPMSDEEHCCLTCETHYVGNFCPRCGQSANMGRFSFKKAFLLFLDVWGMGNRSMPRTIRDLVLRPGYMIRDYLKGRYMAYFPPFKMLFLLVALSLVVSSGLNILGQNQIKMQQAEVEKAFNNGDIEAQLADDLASRDDADPNAMLFMENIQKITTGCVEYIYRHYAIATLLWLILLSGPLFWLFRKGPAIRGVRYAEFFVGLTYIDNMMTIYSTVLSFFCLSNYMFVSTLIFFTPIIALKQYSGYGYWQTALRYIATYTIACFVLLLLIFAATFGFAVYLVYDNMA